MGHQSSCPQRWCLAALWTESESTSTAFALLLPGILKRPRKAVNVILCGRCYEKVVVVGLHSRILTGPHFLYEHAGLTQNLVPAPVFEP
jgi:hypothetical protein